MAKKDMESVFGVISSASYNRIHIIEKELNKRLSVLVLDALDGLCVIPFAKSGNIVESSCLCNCCLQIYRFCGIIVSNLWRII